MANVILAIYIVPMTAPTVGAALLALSSWRAIYLVPIAGGLMLLMAMSGMSESAKIDPYARLGPTPIVRNYLRIQPHPVCVGNILCNAAAIGSMFAYFIGSSLFFIDALCLKPFEYGVIFGGCSLWVMAGARGSRKPSGWGLSPAQVIKLELALSNILAISLLLMGGKSAVVVVLVMVGVALSFGLISPYATKEALRQIPEIGVHQCRKNFRANDRRRLVQRNRRAFRIFEGGSDVCFLLVVGCRLRGHRSSGRRLSRSPWKASPAQEESDRDLLSQVEARSVEPRRCTFGTC